MEAKQMKSKSNWNLVNHCIDKIYIIEAPVEGMMILPINTYPSIFRCFDSITDIEMVHVYKQSQRLSGDKIQHSKVGTGKFWNG